MTTKNLTLEKLLNSESFIRWVKGEAAAEEKREWDRWLLKSLEHRRLTQRARRILNMPFLTLPEENDELEQLRRLYKKITKGSYGPEEE